jgi:hypothetical protein
MTIEQKLRQAFKAGQKYGEDNACNAEINLHSNEDEFIKTMTKPNNIAVKSLGGEHGKRIIAAFDKLGVYTFRLGGCVQGRYYGVYDGIFGSENILPFGVEELTIEQLEAIIEPVYPKVMMVNNDGYEAYQRTVIGDIEYKGHKYFIGVREHDHNDPLFIWKHAKDIEPEHQQEVHLTLEDISNGKGVGVPAHLIRIKK